MMSSAQLEKLDTIKEPFLLISFFNRLLEMTHVTLEVLKSKKALAGTRCCISVSLKLLDKSHQKARKILYFCLRFGIPISMSILRK